MKPETADYLDYARESLTNARAILAVEIPKEAARNAYYAAFHAAQALIFERAGKTAKTHDGVHREFNRLAKDEPAITRDLRGFWREPTSLRRHGLPLKAVRHGDAPASRRH